MAAVVVGTSDRKAQVALSAAASIRDAVVYAGGQVVAEVVGTSTDDQWGVESAVWIAAEVVDVDALREDLAVIAWSHHQEAIALTVAAEVTMVTPTPCEVVEVQEAADGMLLAGLRQELDGRARELGAVRVEWSDHQEDDGGEDDAGSAWVVATLVVPWLDPVEWPQGYCDLSGGRRLTSVGAVRFVRLQADFLAEQLVDGHGA